MSDDPEAALERANAVVKKIRGPLADFAEAAKIDQLQPMIALHQAGAALVVRDIGREAATGYFELQVKEAAKEGLHPNAVLSFESSVPATEHQRALLDCLIWRATTGLLLDGHSIEDITEAYLRFPLSVADRMDSEWSPKTPKMFSKMILITTLRKLRSGEL